jgi:hypothetical protein
VNWLIGSLNNQLFTVLGKVLLLTLSTAHPYGTLAMLQVSAVSHTMQLIFLATWEVTANNPERFLQFGPSRKTVHAWFIFFISSLKNVYTRFAYNLKELVHFVRNYRLISD